MYVSSPIGLLIAVLVILLIVVVLLKILDRI